jgi:thiamine-phosphate pyrophosphorylase
VKPAFEPPIVYLITKGEATPDNFVEKREEIINTIRIAVEENVSFIQLREKQLSSRPLFELVADAAAITRGTETKLLVNHRADIAHRAKADGVHLPANYLPAIGVIRMSFPNGFVIGASTHSLDETLKASVDGADFAVFGPVFKTPDKDRPQGIGELTEVVATVEPFPVLAIGGINEENIPSILDAGAAGFAAIRALNNPDSLRSICCKLRSERRI